MGQQNIVHKFHVVLIVAPMTVKVVIPYIFVDLPYAYSASNIGSVRWFL
jgi:hypothetical protein